MTESEAREQFEKDMAEQNWHPDSRACARTGYAAGFEAGLAKGRLAGLEEAAKTDLAQRIYQLERALGHYTQCPHGSISCPCTDKAKASLYEGK